MRTQKNLHPVIELAYFVPAAAVSVLQLREMTKRRRKRGRVLANPGAAPNEWDDDWDADLEQAAKDGDKWLREELGRGRVKPFRISWFAPLAQRRVFFPKPVAAHTGNEAIKEVKALIGANDRELKRRGQTPVNFRAEQMPMEHLQSANPKKQKKIVAFKIGDFYEFFGADAIVAKDILGLTLTKRYVGGKPTDTIMAGFPYHALERNKQLLKAAGWTLQIMEDNPGTAANPKNTIRVAEIPGDYQFVSDSQEVAAIKDYIGGRAVRQYDAFFVKVGDGDYESVYGIAGTVAYNDKMAYSVFPRRQRNPKQRDLNKQWEASGYTRSNQYIAFRLSAPNKRSAQAQAKAQNAQVSDPQLRVKKFTVREVKPNPKADTVPCKRLANNVTGRRRKCPYKSRVSSTRVLPICDKCLDDLKTLQASQPNAIVKTNPLTPPRTELFATTEQARKYVQKYVADNNIDAGKWISASSISRGKLLITFAKRKFTVTVDGVIDEFVPPRCTSCGNKLYYGEVKRGTGRCTNCEGRESNPRGVILADTYEEANRLIAESETSPGKPTLEFIGRTKDGKFKLRRKKAQKSKRNPGAPEHINALARMFHGHVTGATLDVPVSEHHKHNKDIQRIGRLPYIKMHNRPQGSKHASPKHACNACAIFFPRRTSWVSMNGKRRIILAGNGVHSAGQRLYKMAVSDNPRANGGEINLGRIEVMAYITPEKHSNSNTPILYYHPHAEETGRVRDMPSLHIDRNGMLYIPERSGNYDIDERGIIN